MYVSPLKKVRRVMTTTKSNPGEQEMGERRCEVCQELRRVIAKVGPLLIKEPCPNKCATGYQKLRTDR
jgi:hypothetical protein